MRLFDNKVFWAFTILVVLAFVASCYQPVTEGDTILDVSGDVTDSSNDNSDNSDGGTDGHNYTTSCINCHSSLLTGATGTSHTARTTECQMCHTYPGWSDDSTL